MVDLKAKVFQFDGVQVTVGMLLLLIVAVVVYLKFIRK